MRFKPWQIDTVGASTGDALVYDQPTDSYIPGPVSGGGTTTTVDETEPNRPLGPFTKKGVVITTGGTGTWDAALVESACPVFDPESQRYALIYTGYSGTIASPTNAKLGIAWSLTPEGPYVKDAGNPILGGTGSSGDPDESGVTGCMAFRKADGTWTIYSIGLNAGGYEGGAPTLCRYTTPSLVTPSFTRHGVAVDIGGTSWRQSKVWCGSIVEDAGTFHMFLNGTATDTKERIGHASASSIDGPWTVDTSPVLDVGGSGAWDAQNVGQPWVFKLGETWYMEYYGVNAAFTSASDGIATTTEAAFPHGWTKHPSNPFLTPGPDTFDAKFAHKPFSLVLPDRICHFYTAVAASNARQIALAVIGRSVSGVSSSRAVNTDSTLTGGGDLSTDRTLGVDTTAEAERIRDVIGAALVAGSNVTITVNDAGDTITIAASGTGSSTALVPMVSQIGTGDPDLVWTDAGELLLVEVPL